MKTPKIADVAKKLQGTYRSSEYECKFCKKRIDTYYDDMKPVRSHMLRYHRTEYYATVEYIIHEEADHLWALAK